MLLLGSSAQKEWHKAQAWNKAVAGIALQIEGSRQQLAAQARRGRHPLTAPPMSPAMIRFCATK